MTATTTTSPVSTDLTAGTRAVVIVTASGATFAKNVALLKRMGGQFDATGKVWVVKLHEGNVAAARHLVSAEGNYTGFQVIDNAAWVARRQNGGR